MIYIFQVQTSKFFQLESYKKSTYIHYNINLFSAATYRQEENIFLFVFFVSFKRFTIINLSTMKKISYEEVVQWAEQFLEKAENELTPKEVKEQRMFASLIQNPTNKTLLSMMLDESSQIRDNKTMSRRMKLLFDRYGIPDFFSSTDQFLIWAFMKFGYWFDFIAMPIFKSKLRQETNKIIIAEERPSLTNHLAKRWNDDIGQNVNLLGEVVLGDKEANNRYESYLDALKEKDINYISVKLSGIYAQIRPLNYEKSKEELCKLMTNIYRRSIEHPYIDKDGISKPKFVNLDMEEYKDTDITLDVFTTVLSMPEFKDYYSGIVIQAYLPDAELFYDKLLAFAKKRVAEGGSPIKIRLVKGANQQMESIISSIRGWANPILPNKIDVDANYMHILDKALLPENASCIHIGVASHNFFTIGYAYLLSQELGSSEQVTFEMLEGMANHLPRVMKSLGKHIILYTPVVKKEHFLNAVSYLVRRMDENTGEDNFLRYSFGLHLNTKEWLFLADQFKEALARKDSMKGHKNRQQDRSRALEPRGTMDVFQNEPDTDLDLPQNRSWALANLKRWETEVRDSNFIIPVQVGDQLTETEHKKKYYDRSRGDSVSFCEANFSTPEQVNEIIQIAEKDASEWRKTPLAKRKEILHRTADNISANRGDFIACMSAITGKTFTEGDVEVSEGIDFCRFYPITMETFEKLPTVSYTPKGVIMVIPPWNFPFAIPVGGVAAALAGGNSVLLKPATVALPVAWKFAQCFWDAGVPKDALQVVCPADRNSLNVLSSHPVVKHIILTGGTDTAFRLLENSPRTPLSAETGGKNAIILTASGDQDHAILNIVASAFLNSGQKCSACSRLLVDEKTYYDEAFKAKLKDAVESMHTGSVWDPDNQVGPMITNQNDKLLHAIENMEPGESWLVPPVFLDENKYILKPCVKWGVKPGSFTFENELFGPLLAVTPIKDLEEGIALTNSSAYGLTSGLQSLDERERELWKNNIEAGNLYINRGITGAIVNRQPFGGMKRSAFGGGSKAGGVNYVSTFVNFEEKEVKTKDIQNVLGDILVGDDLNRFAFASHSYREAWKDVFSKEVETAPLYGEFNSFRYLPLKNCVLRANDQKDSLIDIYLIMQAASTAKTPLTVSLPETMLNADTVKTAANRLSNITVIVESEADFMASMKLFERARACSPESLSDAIYQEAAKLGLHIGCEKPLVEGRLELLHYLKEQSISFEYHRYGSIFIEPK